MVGKRWRWCLPFQLPDLLPPHRSYFHLGISQSISCSQEFPSHLILLLPAHLSFIPSLTHTCTLFPYLDPATFSVLFPKLSKPLCHCSLIIPVAPPVIICVSTCPLVLLDVLSFKLHNISLFKSPLFHLLWQCLVHFPVAPYLNCCNTGQNQCNTDCCCCVFVLKINMDTSVQIYTVC